jgi:flavin reductase (DIM6/NTAB) family NADH-FMN oxidoreductase RutF
MISLFRLGRDRPIGPGRVPGAGRVGTAGSVDEASFRSAMAGAVQGVGIVTTDGPGGRAGITVGSVVSASLEPPLLMVCIRRRAPALDAIVRNRAFCANLLAAHHKHLADVFAGRPRDGAPYDFDRATWITGVTGSPALLDAAASFDCVLEDMGRVGTHQALLGRCVGVREADGPPLLYTGRRYAVPSTWSPGDVAASTHDLGNGGGVI